MKISSKLTALRYKYTFNTLFFLNKNNAKARQYQEEGLKLLAGKVEKLPEKVAFRPYFITQSSCVKVFDRIYLFISKVNFKKPAAEKFDAFFHEIGHWLHFQQMPPVSECRNIWESVNEEKIKNDVSEYAIKKKDGREFVAEVFKGLVKGKKYDDYIMNLYKRLNGPKVFEE